MYRGKQLLDPSHQLNTHSWWQAAKSWYVDRVTISIELVLKKEHLEDCSNGDVFLEHIDCTVLLCSKSHILVQEH